MNFSEVQSKIDKLAKNYGAIKSKYRRNLRLYEYSPTLSLDNLNDDYTVGYYRQGFFESEEDTTSSVQENVIRSCIDTLTSKIASQKVRAYFNTIGGSYKDRQTVKQAQQYFDVVYDYMNIPNLIARVFKDACIFEKGILYIDRDNKTVQRILPWQVYIDPREASYGVLTKLAWVQNQYPVSLLGLDKKELENIDYVTFEQYWDLNEGKKYYVVKEINYIEEEKWEPQILPFCFLYYDPPIKATTSQSVVDLLYGIQLEIDAIVTKIKDASQIAPINKYFVPVGSNIKASQLTSRTAEVIEYNIPPGMNGSPVTVATDAFMDPQWLATLQQFKNDAYELVGISQLSATSQKPKGLNSGVALSTMEDIESDRFETQLNSVIRLYKDLALAMLSIFRSEEEILPPNELRRKITWGEIVEAKDNFKIQYSSQSLGTNDPQTKMEILSQMAEKGWLPKSRIAQLMDLPDLQLGNTISQNAINAVEAVIEDCIENDNYNIPDYVPTDMLMDEIQSTMLSLKAAQNPENERDIQKLMALYEQADAKNVTALTNAELAATQGLQQELATQMQSPEFQQQIAGIAQSAQGGQNETL